MKVIHLSKEEIIHLLLTIYKADVPIDPMIEEITNEVYRVFGSRYDPDRKKFITGV